MKKVLMFGVFLGVIASIQAKEISTIPIEVERNINKFYQGADFSQKNQHINMQRKAYLEMVNYIEEANIPLEEKEGILKNVESMYPNNYIMQKKEAINRVDHVKSLM
mgnify:CR=1 FL=1|jgi:hypothetical protein